MNFGGDLVVVLIEKREGRVLMIMFVWVNGKTYQILGN